MPRTKLGDKYSKPKVPPPNYVSEMLKRYKKAYKVTDSDLAISLKLARVTVTKHINQPAKKWDMGRLIDYCTVLSIPTDEMMDALKRSCSRE